VIEEAYQQAIGLLQSCATPLGFKASVHASGYPHVWARDSAITMLGALLSEDDALIEASKISLVTLASKQTELGMIPLNVDTRTGEVTTENAGAVDANLWFILGHYACFEVLTDISFLRGNWDNLTAAALWLRYQDMNDCGLLEIPEAGDWADLYSVRYNVLYDNVLYALAMRAMALMATQLGEAATKYQAIAQDVASKLNLLMWLERPWDGHEFGKQLDALKALRLEWFLLYQNTATLTEKPFYLPWVGFREFGDTFDTFGNCLAILGGIADQTKTAKILDYAHATGIDDPYPAKAFYPPIFPGDRDWREYYRSRNLNLPYQYHNGGIWPFLGGLYTATLAYAGRQTQAEASLEQLARANQLGKHGDWEFNEWHHGLSGRPMGHPQQAWSAALFIYAHYALQHNRFPFFDSLRLDM
jgi:glycogen debranching enzyme